jgi:hypothetical protein
VQGAQAVASARRQIPQQDARVFVLVFEHHEQLLPVGRDLHGRNELEGAVQQLRLTVLVQQHLLLARGDCASVVDREVLSRRLPHVVLEAAHALRHALILAHHTVAELAVERALDAPKPLLAHLLAQVAVLGLEQSGRSMEIRQRLVSHVISVH